MIRNTNRLNAMLWALFVLALTFWFLSGPWLYNNRPHDAVPEFGQTWRVPFHNADYYLSFQEYIVVVVLLPLVAIGSGAATIVVTRRK